jgi:hypothetical protein
MTSSGQLNGQFLDMPLYPAVDGGNAFLTNHSYLDRHIYVFETRHRTTNRKTCQDLKNDLKYTVFLGFSSFLPGLYQPLDRPHL